MNVVQAAAVSKTLVDALTLGLHGMQAWQQYQAELLARQQQREAEGKELTMDDVRELLAQTEAKLKGNHKRLQALAAAEEASRS